ncbi:MAG: oligogalacturonate lyase family protein [Acidobacteriaceae bacterium]|nr:oligogalacturonate lyase family protein [Acidobacteriaceae bacterium]
MILKGHDWLNHVQFSPTDPYTLMYAHEGPSDKVDRIWAIRYDGTQNKLMHERTDANETVNHEFWGPDGHTIWYDLQKPSGKNFYLASYDVQSGQRKLYHLDKVASSVHYGISKDGTLFCGDGRNTALPAAGSNTQGKTPWSRQWIETLKPIPLDATAATDPKMASWFDFNNKVSGKEVSLAGWLKPERLVNLSKNNYLRDEPNARFSPDGKYVIFTSNMFGSSYVFAVETK